LEQLLSAPAIQFKGSGWYVSDYARKPSGGAASQSADSAPAATSESKADTPKTEGASSAGKSENKQAGKKGNTTQV
jgi:hypothetical protein